MFIGHYAAAFAAKRTAPTVSLGTLFLAAQLVDLLWPLFLLLGFEHVRIDPGNTAVTPLDFYDYPITHSLLGSIVWSFLLALVYYGIRREARSAAIVGLLVFSHWILDFLTHRPDLPLGFGNVFLGLSLWDSVTGTLLLELSLFTVCTTLYFQTTTTRGRLGTYNLWGMIVFLLAIYAGDIFGPPPPNELAIAIAGNALWLFVLWGYWIDRDRDPLTN